MGKTRKGQEYDYEGPQHPASSHSEIQKAASKAIFLHIDYARYQTQDIDCLLMTP